MISTQNRDIVIDGNLNGEKIAMGIDPGSLAKIMGIVTDLYSDKEQAIIREYSTNAHDSHVEAGQTRPIEVTLPSSLSPFFRVKDFGVGMSLENLRNTFSKYGASTKDMSNDFNGMLGLGSKSALTYTSQFTVISVKDGVKITIAVQRANDGTGVMQVVDTCATDDVNGVEVVIPVQFNYGFVQKAERFYSFWKPGTVILNGKEPSLIDGNEVAPGIYSVRGLRGDYIVQGNVAYPVNEEHSLYSGGYYKDFAVVAYVPNGSVSFAPSREALMYDSVTKAECARVKAEFEKGLLASIQSDVDDSDNALEALKRWHNWKQMLGWNLNTPLKYQGHTLGQNFNVNCTIYNPSSYRYQATGHRSFSYDVLLRNVLIVTDYTSDKPSTAHKSKLKLWAEDNDYDFDQYILVDKIFGAPFTNDIEVVSWDDIKDTKINRGPKATGGRRGSQPIQVFDPKIRYFADAEEIDPQGEVYYCSPAENVSTSALNLLTMAEPDATIVMLGKNRWEKFKREFPEATHVWGAMQKHAKTYAEHLTKRDRLILGMNQQARLRNNLLRLDATKVDDPDIVAAIELANESDETAGIKHYRLMSNLAGHVNIPVAPQAKTPRDVLAGYPLLDTSYAGLKVIDHTYIYINAVYAANNKEN